MTDRKVFQDSVTPLPEQGPTAHGLMVSAAEAPDRTESMALLFSVDTRGRAARAGSESGQGRSRTRLRAEQKIRSRKG